MWGKTRGEGGAPHTVTHSTGIDAGVGCIQAGSNAQK